MGSNEGPLCSTKLLLKGGVVFGALLRPCASLSSTWSGSPGPWISGRSLGSRTSRSPTPIFGTTSSAGFGIRVLS
eukprot:7818286-Pyramimonas_sp.AAC.1